MRAVISYTERYGRKIGSIEMIDDDARVPNGALTCDGREVWINDYVGLYRLIGDKYSSDASQEDGNGYFCLPDLRCYLREPDKEHTFMFEGELTEDDNYLDRIGIS